VAYDEGEGVWPDVEEELDDDVEHKGDAEGACFECFEEGNAGCGEE